MCCFTYGINRLASSPGSSQFFNVARRKTSESLACDQPTTVQSMGRVQIACGQCLSPSMQGTASTSGERMRRRNVSQMRHCPRAICTLPPTLPILCTVVGWSRAIRYQVFSRFSACNIEKLGGAWELGYQ